MVVAVSPSVNEIVNLRRERHTRKHEGQAVAWCVTDRYGEALVLSQKLGAVQAFLNARATAPHERVAVSSLYEAATITKHSERTGGYAKGRWAVSAIPLSEVPEKLGRLRPQYDQVFVLAEAGYVTVSMS
eukprot:3838042-Prymnesium_polylepis.1